jgi:hypothetical protein
MENNDFYVWDNHGKVWSSNPDMRDQSEWFVWDPHTWWEYNRALIQGQEFFPNAEICRDPLPPNCRWDKDPRKKVALVFYELVRKPGQQPSKQTIQNLDLGWADIVIVYTTECMPNWWPIVYGEVCQQLHSDQVLFLWNGIPTYTEPPKDIMFSNMRSFFSFIVASNTYQEINQDNVPFRKYMFDALMGTVKTSRLYFLYRLMESDFQHQVLINLQPNPHNYNWRGIQTVDPIGWAKHGAIENAVSPALIDLEEPTIKNFKQQTLNGSAHERYSANLVHRPGFNLPGNNAMSSVFVPWHVYQASWYSIVFETSDTGSSTTFLTEKVGKCLYAKRIFIMMNSAGLLRSLRNLGFKTFHGDIIDESYDDEPDDAKRYAMAWQQIQRLYHTENPRAVYAHFQDVLEHNHQLMLSWPQQQLKDINTFIHQPHW